MLKILFRPRPSTALAVLLALFVGPASTRAQSGPVAGLQGVVLDPSGRTVAAAAIEVTGETMREPRAATADEAGHFVVPGLEPGKYSIAVRVPGFDTVQRSVSLAASSEPITIKLSLANIRESVTVFEALPDAAVAAPSQGSLTARSAQSLISNEFIRNYTSPFSDYSQVIQMAPGAFSVGVNGPGLGDTKTFFRGFKDGYYSMTFDGIPFNDTNDPTHHSWVFFPAQTIGSTVFERSPGSATSIGPSTFGGSVNLLSRSLPSDPLISATLSYGSFNTRLLDLQYDSGQLGKARLLIEGHEMRSDGYQTYNYQKRDAFSAKFEYAATQSTVLTAFSSVMDLHSNTPNQKGSTRALIQQFGDNFLNSGDPTSPLYYKFNFYHVPTNFEYVGIRSDLGHGWSIDNKIYTMSYHNKQNFNGLTSITATSGTDKLNSYWKVGNLLPLSHVSDRGVFRVGLWTEFASTDRYQTPTDPRTWVNAALPNFHEKFGTTTIQPYAEYQFRAGDRFTLTPGIKYAHYNQDFTQFADNGKTVGNLNGAPFIKHAVDYNAWLPSLDAHYSLQTYWSAYAQYGKGQNIPPSNVFDVKNAAVGTPPKPILSDTFQVGTVWKSGRATLDMDAYYIKFQSDYSSTLDPVTGESNFFLNGKSVTKGVELESTILVGNGVSLYLNAMVASAKYDDSGRWVQNAPKDMETVGLTYNQGKWNLGILNKRVGALWNDNGSIHQAIPIDPFNITNAFVNYSVGGTSRLAKTRLRLAINNLTDIHPITAIAAASTRSNAAAPGDVLTLMAGRSVAASITLGFSPKSH
jgi:iron complex outermembrane receptor protein